MESVDESKLETSDYDFCINCNTVLLEDSRKISKLYRRVSHHPESPLSFITVPPDSHDDHDLTMEVSLITAISAIFNIPETLNDKHFVCEKCGNLLELAYNAILDFMGLTRRGSELEGKLQMSKHFLESLPPNLRTQKGAETDENQVAIRKKSDKMSCKRSQRLMKAVKAVDKGSSQKAKQLSSTPDIKTEPETVGRLQTAICSLCGKPFISEALLKKHKKLFHQSNIKPHKQMETTTKRKVSKEIESQENPHENSSDDPTYCCTICELEFEEVETFQKHLQLHEDRGEVENDSNGDHGTKPKTEEMDDDVAEYDLTVEKLKCKLCSESQNCSLDELKDHYSKKHPLVSILTVTDMHNVEKDNNSDNTEEPEENTSKRTTATNGRIIFNCNVCNKQFIRHDHIVLHLRTHTGEKPFLCNVEGCGKAFSDPRGLAYHEVTHSNERPYCCKFCGMTFKRLHHLNDHERNHNEVPRRFVCQFCEKAFKHRKHLNSHLVIHRGTKEHQCDLCFKAFNRKDNLRQHIKKVHGKDSAADNGNDMNSPASAKEIGKSGKSISKQMEERQDGIPTASSLQTVLFHTASGAVTTGTIIATTSAPNVTSGEIINLPTSSASVSSSVVMTAALKGSINSSSSSTTTTTIPVAIAISDQTAIDQIVYMHL